MKFPLTCILLIFSCTFFINCKSENKEANNGDLPDEEQWTSLFNGKDLTGWDTYLGMPYEEGKDVWAQKQQADYNPFGLNNDPLGVFTVVEQDGAPALRISGEVLGGISTVEEYENYHLQLQFKWGEEKHEPRLDAPRDSGILYHGNDEQGTEGGFWLRSQEFQVQEGDCGDYWGVAGAQMDIRAEMTTDSIYQYNPDGILRDFGDHSYLGRHVKKLGDGEKPNGEWNTLDLYCYAGESAHVVNGTVVMQLENSTIIVDSIEKPLTKGKIQLQTEGAEVFYRNIQIKPINKFPETL
tara:strand:+ start:131 stop:1018 length:888 start_codon:yes stop_codon:yes gene_type:complete